jgi:hypothetical protein
MSNNIEIDKIVEEYFRQDWTHSVKQMVMIDMDIIRSAIDQYKVILIYKWKPVYLS